MSNFSKSSKDRRMVDAIALTISEKQIHFTHALDVFADVGKVLQSIPKNESETAIATLRNKARDFGQQGDLLSSMMLIHLIQAWEER